MKSKKLISTVDLNENMKIVYFDHYKNIFSKKCVTGNLNHQNSSTIINIEGSKKEIALLNAE